jgi:hypothetical protein
MIIYSPVFLAKIFLKSQHCSQFAYSGKHSCCCVLSAPLSVVIYISFELDLTPKAVVAVAVRQPQVKSINGSPDKKQL